jgi:hypothetical protein
MRSSAQNVLAQWEKDGSISPRSLTWQGQSLQVVSVGRSWRDEEGYHVLCMTAPGTVYELLLTPDFTWLVRPPAGRTPA